MTDLNRYTGLDEAYNEKQPIKPADENHEGCDKIWTLRKFPKRYIVAIMAFFGFCNVYALRVNLSVALVAMTTNYSFFINGTQQMVGPEFQWTRQQEGLILGAFFYGYIITQLPGGFLASRIGGKHLFGGGILVTAVLTLLTPVCARWNLYLLIAIRVIEGLFEGVTYPSIHAIWANWAPPMEKTKLATFAFAGSYFGTVISMPISGALAQSAAGWPSIFYVFGTLAVIWFLLWCYIVVESPAKHTTISNSELDYIQSKIGYTEEQSHDMQPPWIQIISSRAVWAIVIAHFAENWGFYTWLTELPSFMKFALNFNLQNAGFLSALPYLVMGSVVIAAGFLADHLRSRFQLNTGLVRKLFTSGAFGFQVVFMVSAGYSTSSTGAVTCLILAVGLGGFAWAGFSVNHLDIAPQYASILMGISNTFATIPGIVSPLLTSVIVEDKRDAGLWQIVFYLAAGIYLLGGLLFGLLASGERQRWAEVPTGYLSQQDIERDDL